MGQLDDSKRSNSSYYVINPICNAILVVGLLHPVSLLREDGSGKEFQTKESPAWPPDAVYMYWTNSADIDSPSASKAKYYPKDFN